MGADDLDGDSHFEKLTHADYLKVNFSINADCQSLVKLDDD